MAALGGPAGRLLSVAEDFWSALTPDAAQALTTAPARGRTCGHVGSFDAMSGSPARDDPQKASMLSVYAHSLGRRLETQGAPAPGAYAGGVYACDTGRPLAQLHVEVRLL